MKRSVFQIIDDFISEQVSSFRNSDIFTQMADTLRSFNEKEQLILNHLSSAFLIVLPSLGVIVLTILKMQTESEIEIRRNVLEKMVSIKSSMAQYSTKEKSLIASGVSFEEKQDFENALNQILESKKINVSSVTVDNFDAVKESGAIKLLEATIKYKDLSSVSYTNLLLDVQTKFKASVQEMETIRDNEKLLLNGEFKISFFSKVEG